MAGWGWSIRRRLVVIVVGMTALVIALALWFVLTRVTAVIIVQAQARITAQNSREAGALDGQLQAAAASLRVLAAAMDGRSGSPRNLLWRAASTVMDDADGWISRVGIIRPYRDGYQTVLIRRPNISSLGPLSTRFTPTMPSLSALTPAPHSNDVQWFGPMQGFYAVSNEPVVMAAARYRSPGGGGIVWVEVSTAAVLEQVAGSMQSNANDRAYRSVFNGYGEDASNLIAFYHANGMNPDPEAEAGQFVTMLPQFAPLMRDMEISVIEVPQNPLDNGSPAFLVRGIVPVTGWAYLNLVPTTDVLGGAGETLLGTVFIVIAGVLLLGYIIYRFVSSVISQPLDNLSTAAQEIGSGDMRYQIGYQRQGDEIGRLALALEEMKTDLSRSYDELRGQGRVLERRVQERTAELETARRDAQNLAGDLQSVYSSSLAVVGETSLDMVLGTITRQVPNLLNGTYCSVWLLTPDEQQLRLVASTADRSTLGSLIPAGDGLAGETLTRRAPLMIDDYARWPRRLGWVAPGIARALAVPLFFSGQPIGALVAGRPANVSAFNESDERLLSLLANMVSPVVRNAQLFIQLDEAVKRAESANEVKTRFLASVTHELRTPLNLVINNMDFMRVGVFGEVNDEQQERLDQTIRSAEHLLYLINDLLDVSKIEAGEMQLFMQPTDLTPVLEDALDSATAYMGEKTDVRLTQHIPDHLPQVEMDARRIRQVLTNLLTNAVKFTPAGEVTFAVSEYDDAGVPSLRFSVQDTGIGIPPDEIERIFEVFERSDRAKQMGIEGTGLGLAISRYLVQAHGGRLWAESETGKGSTFFFVMPLQQPIAQDTPVLNAPVTA